MTTNIIDHSIETPIIQKKKPNYLLQGISLWIAVPLIQSLLPQQGLAQTLQSQNLWIKNKNIEQQDDKSFHAIQWYFLWFVESFQKEVLFKNEKKETILDKKFESIHKKIEDANNPTYLLYALQDLDDILSNLLTQPELDFDDQSIKIRSKDIQSYKDIVSTYRINFENKKATIYDLQDTTKIDRTWHINLETIKYERKIQLLQKQLSDISTDFVLVFAQKKNQEAFDSYKEYLQNDIDSVQTLGGITKIITDIEKTIQSFSTHHDKIILSWNALIDLKKETIDTSYFQILQQKILQLKNNMHTDVTTILSQSSIESFSGLENNISLLKKNIEDKKNEIEVIDKKITDKEAIKYENTIQVNNEKVSLELIQQKWKSLQKKSDQNLLNTQEIEEKNEIEKKELNTKNNISLLENEIKNIQHDINILLTEKDTLSSDIEALQLSLNKKREELIQAHQNSFSVKQQGTIKAFEEKINLTKKDLDAKKAIDDKVKEDLKNINKVILNITTKTDLSLASQTLLDSLGIALDSTDVNVTLDLLQQARAKKIQEHIANTKYMERLIMSTLQDQIQPYADQNVILKQIGHIKWEDITNINTTMITLTTTQKKLLSDIDTTTITFNNLTKKASSSTSSLLEQQRYELLQTLSMLEEEIKINQSQQDKYVAHNLNQQNEIDAIKRTKEFYAKKIQYLEYLWECVVLKNQYDKLYFEKELFESDIQWYVTSLATHKKNLIILSSQLTTMKLEEKKLSGDAKTNNVQSQVQLRFDIERLNSTISGLETELWIKEKEKKNIEAAMDDLAKLINANINMRNTLVKYFKTTMVEITECDSKFCAPSIPQDITILLWLIPKEMVDVYMYKTFKTTIERDDAVNSLLKSNK